MIMNQHFKDLREYNLIRNQIDNDKRRQQTEYLRTKYNTEQMAKANELLSLEINKQKLEQRFLLAGVIILFVILGLIYQLLRQKKEYNLMLEHKVAERTDQLEHSNKILMETNMELERFVFIASHDLKTPLNNIINFTKLLEKRLSNSEDKDTHEYLSFIKEGGIRLNKLIKDTLEYSKQSMQEDQQFEQIDLNKLLEQVEQSISNYIQINNAKIIIQNNLPKIEAHHSSIVVLFQNLIENGIKYNESTEPTINIYHKETNRHHSIFVEDNGIGISEEYHEKVFTMFTRLHSHYTYEGSGLGLSICKKIMQKMGGDITLIKNNDTGSIFELKFPLDIIYTQRI